MALTKYASLEVAQILEVKGSREKITGAGLDKLASYEDYRTDDGYLYTRVRAISSRVNKNHDGWPSEELAKAYLTFLGKPIFVDHNNSDPSRARGVIVDAKLHIENDFEKAAALDPYYASAPENHKPPTWVELLLEVDAKQFPHLAAAIVADEIDGVSMGANVERSKCSHCANWATAPEEYCLHVLQKGADFDKYDDFGRKTTSAAYEDCYDIGFFEISYVFDPADETALDLGDKRHAISKVAARADGTFDGDPTTCSTCGGSGQAGAGPCSTCHGRGVETWPKEDGRTPPKTAEHWHGQSLEVSEVAEAVSNLSPEDQVRMDEFLAKVSEYQKNWDNAVSDRKQEHRDPNQCDYCEGRGCDECAGQGHLSIKEPYTPPLKNYDHLAAGEANPYLPGGVPADNHMTMEPKRVKEGYCASCDGRGFIGDGSRCTRCGGDGIDKRSFTLDKEGNVHYAGPMDMGGYGDGTTAPAASTPMPGAPAQPGADMNCPQCGAAMQDGVCPQCSATPNEAPNGADPSSGGMMPMSFKLDKAGNVKYSDDMGMTPDMPIPGDDTMDRLNAAPPAPDSPQSYADNLGETPRQVAEKAIQISNGDADKAIHIVTQWFPEMSEFDAHYEVNHLLATGGEPYPDMPNDPFLSHIAKDGTVHYAQPDLPQSMMTTAPEGVDTLRQEKICEVCGSDMDDGKCEVCGFEVPPEGFDNPDLEKAQQIAEQGAAEAPMPGGEAPPGAMAPPGGAPGGAGGGISTPAPSGPPAGGGQPMSRAYNLATANTIISGETPVVTNERTAGTIRKNEQPIIPATKTVSDHPTTTTVTKEPTRLVQSNTKDNMTKTLTKAAVVAQMVKRGTNGVKTEAEAEALLKSTGLERLLAASPASDPAEHSQSVDQVGGEVDNPESGTTHENVEKVQDIEAIPTKTWSGMDDQTAPVTNEAGDLGGPIGDALASVKTAEGQSGVLGDPTNADKQVDVNKPMMADGVVGPDTQTFKSDDFHITDPVTTEDSNIVGGPIGTPLSSVRGQIVAHFISALKVAEEMVSIGLIPEEQKYEQIAQLEQETPEQLAVRSEMLSKTRTAGLGKGRVAASPKLPLGANSTRTASVGHDINDDNLGDAGLFR